MSPEWGVDGDEMVLIEVDFGDANIEGRATRMDRCWYGWKCGYGGSRLRLEISDVNQRSRIDFYSGCECQDVKKRVPGFGVLSDERPDVEYNRFEIVGPWYLLNIYGYFSYMEA